MFFADDAAAARPAAAAIVDASVIAAARADAAPVIAPPLTAGTITDGRTNAQPAAVIDYPQAAAELVELATAGFFPAYPALEVIYTERARAHIARALAPVLRKYGYDPAFLPPEAALILCVLPLIKPTIEAVKIGRNFVPQVNNDETKIKKESGAADVSRPIIDNGAPPPVAAADADKNPLARFPTLT